MKRLSFLFIAMFIACGSQAQFVTTPHLPAYTVINQPGASLAQVIDTMYAYADSSDSSEGGAMDQIQEFQRIWESCVTANDSYH